MRLGLTHPFAGLAATCLASAIVIGVLVGSRVLLHPASTAVGFNPASDFQVMTWSLAWWPWAILHAANPFHTTLLWPPEGFSTLWMTTIPFPALLALPLTLAAGPLVSYNVLSLLAAPLAAGAAYLLCRELTDSATASAVAGLLFGLSPYLLGHTLSQHLDLSFVFPIPLLALLVVRFVRGRTSARRLVIGAAALLLLQLGSSFELFLDLSVIVAVGFLLAILGSDGIRRRTFIRAGALVAAAYAVCLPVLVPILVLALTSVHAPLHYAPSNFSIDALNVVVPTPTLLAGTAHAAQAVSQHFVSNIGEQDGYLGLPLLIVAALAVRAEWRRGAWLAGTLLLVALLLSFGPTLTVGGRPLVGLPFAVARLPLLRNALPARMSVFAALAAACLCALWLARPQAPWLKLAVAGLLIVSLLPNFRSPQQVPGAWSVSSVFRWSTDRAAVLGRRRPWTRRLPRGATVLVLPTGDRTAASYWQAMSGMRFRLAVPATPFVPPQVAAAPVIRGLVNNDLATLAGRRLAAARLRAFVRAEGIRDVVVSTGASPAWRAVAAAATSTHPSMLAREAVYRVPSGLAPIRASGDFALARAAPRRSGAPARRRFAAVVAWLSFDGIRARVRVRFQAPGKAAFGRAVALSSPTGDADTTAAAVDDHGRAVVAFTEWRSHRELLRLAIRVDGRWVVETVDSQAEPIWSPQVVITRSGTSLAAWVDQTDPTRTVRATALETDGRWLAPVTLERGLGFGNVTLAAGTGVGVCAWHDGVSSEARVRAAFYDGTRWKRPTTVTTSLATISRVRLVGRDAAAVRWGLEDLDDTRPRFFEARRVGDDWSDPMLLAQDRARRRTARIR